VNSATGVSGITSTTSPFAYADMDQPGNKFIIIASSGPDTEVYDWRKPQNNLLWQGVNGTNNPCPSGWRIATKAEWDAENLQNSNDAFTKLKLTLTGNRDVGWGDGTIYFFDAGYYWTSTLGDGYVTTNTSSFWACFTVDSYTSFSVARGSAYAVRCIKEGAN
jgi:hypothetical protein